MGQNPGAGMLSTLPFSIGLADVVRKHKVMVLWSLPKDLSENIKNVRKYVLETGEMILRVLTSSCAGMGWEIPGISKF